MSSYEPLNESDALINARGFGFFDDDYHLSHVRHIIQSRKEQK